MLNRILYLLAVCMVSNAAIAIEKVATVSPVSFTLTQAMLNGTTIQVDYLPPKRLPMSRVPSWIIKHKTDKFPAYDVLVTLSSIRSEFDFFNTLRQTNIRISKIDMATAMLPKGEKVIINSAKEYFWLNNNNLLLMLGVLKRDLALMWPKKQAIINKNYQTLSALIRQLNLTADNLVQTNDIAFLTSDNKKYSPLGASLSSDFVTPDEAKDMGLNYLNVSSNKKNRSENLWMIDDFTRISKDSFIQRLQNNGHNLNRVIDDIGI